MHSPAIGAFAPRGARIAEAVTYFPRSLGAAIWGGSLVNRKLFAPSIGALIVLGLSNGTALATSPVDSNSALSGNGGGCYSPPIVQSSPFDMLPAVNPEWAPVVNGSSPFTAPVLVHGTAVESHVSKQDFPAGHVTFDQNTEIKLDAADSGFLATGNLAPSNLENGVATLELEWETGSYPAWAWAGEGDRIVALGRWIFDCGHPDPIPGHKAGTTIPCLTDADQPAGVPCVGAVFNYRSEMHPPQAVAVIRSGKAAQLDAAGRAVPATQADVFVSPDGGGAGDACVVTHKTSVNAILGSPCFPLAAPLALIPIGGVPPLNSRDFAFDVPLPRVSGGRDPVLRVLPHAGTAVPASLDVTPVLDGAEPHYHVTVRMTQPIGGHLPTGFAATLLAGWRHAPASPVVHLRVVLDGVTVNNPLKSGTAPAGWKMQAAVDGQWQEVAGLDGVNASSAGQAFVTPASFDLFLPRSGDVDLRVAAASRNCADTLFGKSLLTDLIGFGFNPADPATLPGALARGVACLQAEERDAGSIELSFSAPHFGAIETPHTVTSSNGAYTLRLTIQRVEDDS